VQVSSHHKFQFVKQLLHANNNNL